MKEADEKTLSLYTLDPPEWRAQLIANKEPRLYPDFFPGATALYPQSTTQTGSHVPGMSRDGSAANAGAGGNQHVPIPGVTASKEDELSEHAVKLGFVNKAVVQVSGSHHSNITGVGKENVTTDKYTYELKLHFHRQKTSQRTLSFIIN